MNEWAGKTVLITAGGTREYIDDVRVVTNISSGALGACIAEELYRRGAKIHFVHARHGIIPSVQEGISDTARLNMWPIVTVQDLYDTMKTILTAFKVDAVIHSAAVSDFTFKHDGAVKLSSSSAEDFIEYMRKTITPTPKIISKVKQWSPSTHLVGFKFTVGKAEDELADIAWNMGKKVGCDFVVANDKERMKEARSHLAVFVNENGVFCRAFGKEDIAKKLAEQLEGSL